MHRLVRGISAKRRCFNPDLFELNLDLNFNVNVISQSKFASKAKVGRPSTGVSFYAPKIKPQETFLTVDEQLLPLVAIIGKPNVGKSALFNRFGARAQALVKNTPDDHVTRDYREGRGKLGDLWFKAVDTSGLEPYGGEHSIHTRATQLTLSVLQKADLALLLLDARDGVSSNDEALAKWLRENVTAPIVLAANKAENSKSDGSGVTGMLADATGLGLGEPIAISAETGEGMMDLYTGMQPILDKNRQYRQELWRLKERDEEEDSKLNRVSVAVVGVPNAGKSTLMNKLLGRERSLTGPEPGLTRDAVYDSLSFRDHQVDIIDTAGWLDRSRLRQDGLGGKLAEQAQLQTQRSYNRAHIILLVIDALTVQQGHHGLLKRELALVRDIVKEGRAIVVLLNKVDTVEPGRLLEVEARLERQLQQSLPDVQGAQCLSISALTGDGVDKVLPAVIKAYGTWNQRIGTHQLNKWLVKTAEKYGNEASNHILRIRYLTQASTRPPTLVAFVSGSADYPTASIKFLGNALRQEFGFDGVPLRIDIRMRKAEGGVKGKRSSNRGRSTNRPARPYQRQRMAA